MNEKAVQVLAFLAGATGYAFAMSGCITMGLGAFGVDIDYWRAAWAVALFIAAHFGLGVAKGALER